MRRIIAGGLLLALAGCGQASPPPDATVTPAATTPAVDYAARLAALTERERAGVLFRAIRDAGRECQGVTDALRAGEVEGAPAWLATCDGGARWIVALRRDGTAAVTDPRRVVGG